MDSTVKFALCHPSYKDVGADTGAIVIYSVGLIPNIHIFLSRLILSWGLNPPFCPLVPFAFVSLPPPKGLILGAFGPTLRLPMEYLLSLIRELRFQSVSSSDEERRRNGQAYLTRAPKKQ